MSIRTSAFTITIGKQQQLEMAQGEDREFQLTFLDPVTGLPRDFTAAQAVLMTVKNRSNGIEIFSRSLSGYVGGATGGTPRFQVLQADTVNEPAQPYDVDATWTDATGYKEQLLVLSTFELVQGVGQAGDAVTTPPAIPVIYGLTWLNGMWSSPTGGYNLNDSIQAYDRSLGATAISTFRATIQGVTYYPIGPTGALNTGWNYIGQHGAAGVTGVTGVAGAAGATGPGGVGVLSSVVEFLLGSTGVATILVPPGSPAAGLYELGFEYRVSTGLSDVDVGLNWTDAGGQTHSENAISVAGMPTGTYQEHPIVFTSNGSPMSVTAKASQANRVHVSAAISSRNS